MNTIKLNKKEFDSYQLEEIYLGLKDDLDVSIYAKPEYDDYQMKQIRLGLLSDIDVYIYAKPQLSYLKMNEEYNKLLNQEIDKYILDND